MNVSRFNLFLDYLIEPSDIEEFTLTQKITKSTIFFMFLKEGCIYLIKNTVKYCEILL